MQLGVGIKYQILLADLNLNLLVAGSAGIQYVLDCYTAWIDHDIMNQVIQSCGCIHVTVHIYTCTAQEALDQVYVTACN